MRPSIMFAATAVAATLIPWPGRHRAAGEPEPRSIGGAQSIYGVLAFVLLTRIRRA